MSELNYDAHALLSDNHNCRVQLYGYFGSRCTQNAYDFHNLRISYLIVGEFFTY